MSYLERIRAANRFDRNRFMPFVIDGQVHGCVRHGFAERLGQWPEVFTVQNHQLRLSPALAASSTPVPERSLALAEVCVGLRQAGVISGWRDELYPVCERWGAPPVLLLERAAIPFFGITAYGVHMNGFAGTGEDQKMWIARRSRHKATGAGKLDQLVAGGQPHGIGLRANLIKECHEEAGIPASLAERARPVGALSYVLESEAGLRPDIIFNFDLELPGDFQPVNTDGEVEAFYCREVRGVMATVEATREFKFNCALVQIDFLIRHGHIPADHPDYEAICTGLHPFAPGGLEKLFSTTGPAG